MKTVKGTHPAYRLPPPASSQNSDSKTKPAPRGPPLSFLSKPSIPAATPVSLPPLRKPLAPLQLQLKDVSQPPITTTTNVPKAAPQKSPPNSEDEKKDGSYNWDDEENPEASTNEKPDDGAEEGSAQISMSGDQQEEVAASADPSLSGGQQGTNQEELSDERDPVSGEEVSNRDIDDLSADASFLEGAVSGEDIEEKADFSAEFEPTEDGEGVSADLGSLDAEQILAEAENGSGVPASEEEISGEISGVSREDSVDLSANLSGVGDDDLDLLPSFDKLGKM